MYSYIVVDLGFGDAGKGLLTDYLVRRHRAGLVVRYNGGAQAGHNVVAPDGRHHTFAQFGSGTFVPGVKTILSADVIVHPGALLVEGDVLASLGIHDVYSRLRISDRALIITPFHQAANRVKEAVRGEGRHGSCGVGVGAAYEDTLDTNRESIRAGDLMDIPVLRKKLKRIRDFHCMDLEDFCRRFDKNFRDTPDWPLFDDDSIIDRWIASISRITEYDLVWPEEKIREWFQAESRVVFEGAQGILLDADAGFHPHTTWSNCSAKNALGMIHEVAPDSEIFTWGVLRSHMARHGNGPLPTETSELNGSVREHNHYNEWQGSVRYGWFDAVLARYALKAAGKIDALAVTHMDSASQSGKWTYCDSYVDSRHPGKVLTGLPDIRQFSLEEKEMVTDTLLSVKPLLNHCESGESQIITTIESLLHHPVGLVSCGQKAADVHEVTE